MREALSMMPSGAEKPLSALRAACTADLNERECRSAPARLPLSSLRQARHTSVMEIESQEPIVIPHCELSAGALRGVLESFVLREGTDYGEREVSLDQKVAQVLVQLERGEAHVIFHAALESIDIVVSNPSPQRPR
jgi:uncharacterized protein YheU (UPF0270 family)